MRLVAYCLVSSCELGLPNVDWSRRDKQCLSDYVYSRIQMRSVIWSW